jgi:predicted O-linked N-acetylglucosamine transferase (SPINDLY family)
MPVPDLATGREALLAGDPLAAVDALARAAAADPADVEARYWLASACMLAGDGARAGQTLGEARTLHALAELTGAGLDLQRLRTDPVHANDIAGRLGGHGLMTLASVVWEMAIAAGGADPHLLTSYGLSLQHQGRVEEAGEVFRVTAANFGSRSLRQFFVYTQLFCEDGERRHAEQARLWSAAYPAPPSAAHPNPPLAGRRLRIGFVALSFAASQLRQFIAPILDHLDPEAVEVILYPAKADTEADWPSWIAVRPIGALDDVAAAALIRRDGVDILNDCWGHAAGSRLGVFAHKPAPVQVAWINFFQTTGLPQMDYVLHAAGDAPPEGEALFTEELWPLGPVFTPFRPSAGRLPPAPTPALATGQITFGSFNHPAKLSPGAIAAWATVLRNRPGSRLLLKYRYFADPVFQRVMQTYFAAHGVEPERILFEGHSTGPDYFESFRKVDLMLDAWPAPGSTTTLEALSNGAPLLAMVGERPNVGGVYARTILHAVGLQDLVARTPEDFVARALDLTSDLDRLDRLRAQVRPNFDQSPICDESGFARTLERAYVRMFERWSAASDGPAAMEGAA